MKGKKCIQFFITGKVALCCSWTHLVRARNENHVLRICGEESDALPSERD